MTHSLQYMVRLHFTTLASQEMDACTSQCQLPIDVYSLSHGRSSHEDIPEILEEVCYLTGGDPM